MMETPTDGIGAIELIRSLCHNRVTPDGIGVYLLVNLYILSNRKFIFYKSQENLGFIQKLVYDFVYLTHTPKGTPKG